MHSTIRNVLAKIKYVFNDLNSTAGKFSPAMQYLNAFFLIGYLGFFTFFSLFKDIPLPGEYWLLLIFLLLYTTRRLPPAINALVMPLLILFLIYRFTSGIVGEATHIRIEEIISYENTLLPFLPTIKLQSLLFTPGKIHWYDGFAALYYFIGLGIPYYTAFLLFVSKKIVEFQRYTLALILLSVMGYATYLLYPAMPPWLASINGFIPPVNRILVDFYSSIGFQSFGSHYTAINTNPTAAVPSLHMAFTVMPMLFVARHTKYKGKIFAVLCTLAMLFTIIYLGEHYLFDAVIGTIYAVIADILALIVLRLVTRTKLLTPSSTPLS